MSIRFYLTGRICLEVDGRVIVDERQLRGRQGRLAFAYLAAERARSIPREELAKVLWPDHMAPSWEMSLSALISKLRSALSVEPLRSRGVALVSDSGRYQLILPHDGWTDIAAATSAVDEAEGVLRFGQPKRILGPATVAVNICRRPFLPGVEGNWVDAQRRKLERQLIRALDCLSQMGLALDEPSLAIETAIEAIELDPYRERSYQLLMRAYLEGGNAAEALSVYHRLRRILQDELATSPSAETEALYLKMLR